METDRKQTIYKSIMLVVLSVLITFIVTSVFMYQYIGKNVDTKYVMLPNEETSIGAEISKIKTIIDKYYLGEIDENKLRESAKSGYISGLGDKYSAYISKSEYEDFEQSIMGNYIGIGIYMAVDSKSNQILVVSPIKNSPAEAAGLKTGDIIEKVDGEHYEGSDGLEIAASKIKGEEGTVVKLEIKREEKILNFEIKREIITINPITGEILDNNIGYIQVTSFDDNCSKDFKAKYEELVSKNIKGLIIDMRNNGGGIVSEALEMADYIVPKGNKLMITVNKTEEEEIEYAKADPIINIPVVVLVNENSASATEIFSGALMDNGVAKIIGTKTYGKGVIQEILKLQDGSALKLTTEEYFTPNRNKINKEGITPDEIVELPDGVETGYSIERSKDTQLNKAIDMLKK